MAPSLKHKFQSTVPQGPGTRLVGPNAWNDEHDLNLSATGVVLGRKSPGAGPAEELSESDLADLLASSFITPTGAATLTNKTIDLEDNTVTYKAPGTGSVSRPLADKLSDTLHLFDYGAVVSDTDTYLTQNNAALAAAITDAAAIGGGKIMLPPGVIRFDEAIGLAFSSLSYLGTGRITIEGQGSGSSILHFRGTTNPSAAIYVTGGSALNAFGCALRGFHLKGNGASTAGVVGLNITGVGVNYVLDDVLISEFEYGLYGGDIVGLSCRDTLFMFCKYGSEFISTFTTSPPNEMTFINCHWIANQEHGMYVGKGAQTVFVGGSFEGNGQASAGGTGTNRYALKIEDAGYNGVVALALYGTHFENNANLSDLWIVHNSRPCIYHVQADFFRVFNDPTNYVQTNILFETTGATEAKVIVRSGFSGVNGYVEDASRPYIKYGSVTGNLHSIDYAGSLFESKVAIPTMTTQTIDFYSGSYGLVLRAFDGVNSTPRNSFTFGYDSVNSISQIGNFQNHPIDVLINAVPALKIRSAALLPPSDNGSTLGDASDRWTDQFMYPAEPSASAVGEHVSNSATGVSLTTGAPTNIVSISLTAGIWELFGSVTYAPASTTSVTRFAQGINTTSATLPAAPTLARSETVFAATVLVAPSTFPISGVRLTLAATTTVYLVGFSVFTVSTMTASGIISARRIR